MSDSSKRCWFYQLTDYFESGVAGKSFTKTVPKLKACRIFYEMEIFVKLFLDQSQDFLIKGLTN